MSKQLQQAARVVARNIIKRLVWDITDRRGLKQAWAEIEEDVMNEELLPEWERIIAEEICGGPEADKKESKESKS